METEITFVSKYGLSEALASNLYAVYEKFVDGVGKWYVRGDQTMADEVNLFIQNYSGAPVLKVKLREDLKNIGVRKLNEIYGDEVFSNVGEVELLLDIDATYQRGGTPAPRLVQVSQVLSNFKTKRNQLNALGDEASLLSYDLEAGW